MRGKFPGLVLLQMILFLAPWARAQQAAPGGWRISGKVVDARSGAAVARCSVEINPAGDRGTSLAMDTGEDGQFLFAGLAEGKYALSAGKRGYLTQSYEEHDNFSTAIAVGPERKSEGIIFKLVPQAVISGVVMDESGEPLRRAEVRLFKDQERAGIRSTVQRQNVMTDDRGIYEIASIEPGNYYLAVSAQVWYAQAMQRPHFNDKGEEEPASPLDVAYPMTYYPQVTDSEDATPIPVKGGERIQADMTLNAQHAVHIRFPLPGEDPLQHARGDGVMMSQSIFGQTETVNGLSYIVQNGVMEISGIVPGHYDFTVSPPGQGGRIPEAMHFTAEVTSGTTELTPTDAVNEVTVTGKVTSTDGKTPSGGISLLAAHQRHAYQARLDQAGEFDVKVPPGDYEILGQIPQMYLARITVQDGVVKNRVLTVKDGSSPKLELLASKGFGQIEGVAKRDDQPVSGVMVLLAPDDNPFLFRRDQSDSDGTFTLANIVPGHYRLLAVERGWELEWGNRDVLHAFLKKSVAVEVHANDKLTRTVEVQSR